MVTRIVALSACALVASACPCPPVACAGPLTVTFVDAAGAPLTPDAVSLGQGDFTCASSGVTCAGNTLTLLATEGQAVASARATTGERFTGPGTISWQVSDSAAACCEATRTGAITVTLAP